MARLFPLRSDTPAQEGQPRVVDLADEDADAVFGALSSTTARRIYATLSDEPATPSDVAESIDSSIQNVRYHLEKLEDAGLVEVVDTWYSSRGNEMSVYAPANGPLIVTSDESKAAKLKTALSRFIGGVGALAGASLFVQYGLERFVAPGATPSGTDSAPADDGDAESAGTDREDSGDEAADSDAAEPDDRAAGDDAAADGDGEFGITSQDAEEDAADGDAAGDDAEDGDAADRDTAEDDAADGADAPDSEPEAESPDVADDGGADPTYADDPGDPTYYGNDSGVDAVPDGSAEAADAIFGTVPPGLLFFLGGLVVLIAVTVYWYWSTY